MKTLVTGATGYIGSAVVRALAASGSEVLGLVRSTDAVARLRATGHDAIIADFGEASAVLRAVDAVAPDAVVSTASVSGLLGEDFKRSRDTVKAMANHLSGSGKTLIVTSGSAAFGMFAGGHQTPEVYSEDTLLPLPLAVVAPPGAGVPDVVVKGFRSAMAARNEAEQAVLTTPGLRGMVVRPGNVWGRGGSIDIPAQIKMARKHKAAPYFGPGGTTHGYVHVDDLGELFRLALEKGRPCSVFHGVSEEATQRDVATAVSRLSGMGDRTDSVSILTMMTLGGGIGLSLSMNKRLSAERTRNELGWQPTRLNVLADIETGSYAAPALS